MTDVRPPLSPTSSNAKRPSETAASQTQKKQRLDDEQSSNQEQQVVPCERRPPQQDARLDAKHRQLCVSVSRALENAAWTLDEFCNNDADREIVWGEISDDAQRMLAQLVAARSVGGVDRAIVAVGGDDRALAISATKKVVIYDEDAWHERGWLANLCGVDGVDAEVAEAVALLALEYKAKKERIEGTLEALPALEALVGKGITQNDCKEFREKWGLPRIPDAKDKQPAVYRLRLEAAQSNMEAQALLDGEKTVLNKKLDLEMEAFDALPEDEKEGVIGWRSVRLCATLMAGASSYCLTMNKDGKSGNINRLYNALADSGVVIRIIKDAAHTNKDRAQRVILAVDEAFDARPPKEVVEAVIGRNKSLKHAPRTDDAACAALEADLRSRASSFVARGAGFAAKVTPKLPPFPTRDARTLKLRQDENRAWSAAPPAKQAVVWSGLPLDSHVLGTTAPLQKWPKLRGWPTLVADPLTKIEDVELGTIKEMDVLAKKLVHGEKIHQRRRDAAAEESGEEESD